MFDISIELSSLRNHLLYEMELTEKYAEKILKENIFNSDLWKQTKSELFNLKDGSLFICDYCDNRDEMKKKLIESRTTIRNYSSLIGSTPILFAIKSDLDQLTVREDVKFHLLRSGVLKDNDLYNLFLVKSKTYGSTLDIISFSSSKIGQKYTNIPTTKMVLKSKDLSGFTPEYLLSISKDQKRDLTSNIIVYLICISNYLRSLKSV